MDRKKMKSHKSLPPLVKGKIHGYLKLIIDEIIWSRRSLGEVRIFVSWWGETDSAQFRPADITKNVVRSEQETTVLYAIRTNINLFEEYVKNCECIKLAIVMEDNNAVIGTARITDLLEIFELKPLFKYIPIINDAGNNIGKIHISMKLEYITKSIDVQLKTGKAERKYDFDYTVLSTIGSLKNQKDAINDKYNACRKLTPEEREIYKSILKLKRTEFQESLKKVNNDIMDKLVTQVIAKAQMLRGAMVKETYTEDGLDFSNNSLSGSLKSHIPIEHQVKLSEYFLDKDISCFDKHKALHTLRPTSSTSSLINLASDDLKAYEHDYKEISPNNVSLTEANSLLENKRLLREKLCTKQKETLQSDDINCIRIFVESFTLSPAGYRRVKSSSLLHNDSTLLSATYFIQYDVPFGHTERKEEKSMKENKRINICSKTQTNQVIYFNHDGIYKVSKLQPCTEYCIKFKIFVRHLNRKSLSEIGTGTIYINNIIKSENWSIARHLMIVNKGIKIGELSVIVELSSDPINFGNEYVDTIISSKESISIEDITRRKLLIEEKNKRSMSAIETQSKATSQVSSGSSKEMDCLTTDRHLLITKGVSRYERNSMDDRRIDAKDQKSNVEDKILLHGLIYVAEGKELPKLDTYLICRAFWKEDKNRSQICSGTKNPFYQFCQLVPLVHDVDLLDRIKDNYIIIEVYYRNNNVDNLLGLTKLPVHQLYVAYSDPRVLPHLLLSKYPVVSIDGWVPIIDPVTGKSCGELLALVALGTAEQINALLEVSRGLRNITALPPQTISYSEEIPSCTERLQNAQQTVKCNPYKLHLNMKEYSQEDSAQDYFTNIAENGTCFSNIKSQECQTDISTLKESKCNEESQEETSNSEYSALHSLVGRLTQVLNVNKTNTDQVVETEINLEGKKQTSVEEEMHINELNFNTSSNESDISNIRLNFHLPIETYRSVGVGAEYDEGVNQRSNSNDDSREFASPTIIHREKEIVDSACDKTMFRAVVEIECALHLPKIEKPNETVAPSTYVSFQANKSESVPSKQLNSYIITNVFPHSCNPKWNWKCDTKLPVELLLHDEKRLIFKIWRISDTNTSMQVNFEEDIVIGFSAIDLSTLINGFPTISGWFHIMDFTGKCNGQIKICITPMDNLSLFGKSLSTLNAMRIPTCSVSRLSGTSLPYHTHEMNSMNSIDIERSDVIPVREENKSIYHENQLNDSITHVGLEDASMSFLSLSLKQKLTELDEITNRLKSRLRDVTSTAFQDDFENEFELNEPSSDNENIEHKSIDATSFVTSTNYSTKLCQVSESGKELSNNAITDMILNENSNVPSESETSNRSLESCSASKRVISLETVKPSSSKVSNFHTKQSLSNDHCDTQHRNKHSIQNIKSLEKSFSDYPERGTKTHINCLLDKLSLQFPLQLRSTESSSNSAKKNITDSLINLQENNDLRRTSKYSPVLKVCTIPTQTDNVDNEQHNQTSESQMTNSLTLTDGDDLCDNQNSSEMFARSEIPNKISKLIREELVIEEDGDTTKCDELTTYLVASNVRHMDLNNIFNPLLYQHLTPDLYYSKMSSEEEAIEQLDNRYVKIFSKLVDHSTLSKAENFVEISAPCPENAELFRMTPSGISENVDDKIDLTVLQKSSCNDLLASNSTESTTTISLEKSPVKSIDTEMVENSYSISSEISVPVLSRQAPDGGNPVEDIVKPSTVQQPN